MVFHKI